MYSCESWTIKKAEHWRTDAFKLCCCRWLLSILWKARSNQSILKKLNPEYCLEGLTLKLKLQYLGHLMRTGKDPDAGKDWRPKEKRVTEDEMVGWHHRVPGHELGQTPGDGEGQRSLVSCSLWGLKELELTWCLNNKCKFSSSILFFPQWQYSRAFLDRTAQWQAVFCKDGYNNTFHPTCAPFEVTLNIFPLSGESLELGWIICACIWR